MRKSAPRSILTFHAGAIALALAVGILSGLPQVLAARTLGEDYAGVPYLFQDNDVTYLARVHELVDGHTELSSPLLYEYKDGGQSLMPAVGEWLYVPFVDYVSVTKFLFPALLFLLIYAFVYLSARDLRRLTALTAASVSTTGFALLFPFEIFGLFTTQTTEPYLSIWTRLVHPISGGLLLFLLLIAERLSRGGNYWWTALGALALGLSTGYIFSFGIGVVAVALLGLLHWATGERKALQSVLYILVGAAIINLPHFWSAFTSGASGGSAAGQKVGLLLTHEPMVSAVLLLGALVTLGVMAFRRYWDGAWDVHSPLVVALILLGSVIVAMNQQLVTGRTAWPHHFIQYGVPLVYCALALTLSELRELGSRLRATLLIAGIGASLAVGLVSLPTYTAVLDEYRTVNRYAGALEYLRNHEGPCVAQLIENAERHNLYIPAFTHCDVYLTDYVFMGVPDERILHNFLVYMHLMGVTPSTADEFLESNRKRIWAVFFRDWRDLFHDTKDEWLLKHGDPAEIEVWLDSTAAAVGIEYRRTYADPRELFLKYRLDYLIWDSTGATPFDASQFPFLTPVFESRGVVVYRVE
jgi:hypothetical protein